MTVVRRLAGHTKTRSEERRDLGKVGLQYGPGGARPTGTPIYSANHSAYSTSPVSDGSGAGQPAYGFDGDFGVGIGAGLMVDTGGEVQPRML